MYRVYIDGEYRICADLIWLIDEESSSNGNEMFL